MGHSVKLFKTASNGEVSAADVAENFGDLFPMLTPEHAGVEASRCLYCYDAPCMTACPTSINIPKFIKQIHTDDAHGAAHTILSQNILGGTCARACPTEELCEEVCVVHQTEGAPVKIGELQRFAVESLMAETKAHPFERGKDTGKTFAAIGAGPASLAFAHKAAMLGNHVVIFEKQQKPGGLNEYGLAEYKMAGDFARKEVEFLLDIGGIEIRYERALGDTVDLKTLQQDFDGVFVGIGLQRSNALAIPGADLDGVRSALGFIHELRQASPKSNTPIGANVVVIGGGNTAIDAAVQARCLGAQNVTLAYRRGVDEMGATDWEQNLASANGVNMAHWASPHAIEGEKSVARVVFDKMTLDGKKLKPTGEKISILADTVLVAIGQSMEEAGLGDLKTEKGKIVVNESYETSIPGVFAGGDCIASGSDLTVQAVEDGKQAAIAATNK